MRILIVAFCAGLLAAQAPDSRQALSMQRPLAASIAPDGSAVVYVLTRTNWEDNSIESDLYLADLARGTNIRLTTPRKSASAPAWSADSKRIAFLSDRDGKMQVYVMPVAGGEAYALTDHETAVASFEWDGKDGLYFLAADAESAAAKDRRKKYGDLSIADDDHTMSHLWRVKSTELPRQKAERLTEGDFHVSQFTLSPDGKTLGFVARRNPDLSTMGARLEILDLESRRRRVVAETKNQFGRILFSPDSREVAYTTSGEVDQAYYANTWIEARAISGGPARKLSGEVDEQPIPVEWTPRGLLFLVRNKTEVAPYLAAPDGSGVREIAVDSGWNISGVTLSRDFRMAAFIGARRNEAYEVYVSSMSAFAPKAATALRQQWNGFRPAIRELVRWKSNSPRDPGTGALEEQGRHDDRRRSAQALQL